MDDIKITFFMLVTDRDIVVADYAVRSYAKIRHLPFRLRIYSNWISSSLKSRYFPEWRKFDFVDVIDNDWQRDENRPNDPNLEGPFESCDDLWDRELKKITTPYHATVDADFEILDPRFIDVMLAQLDADLQLIAMSTDYSPTLESVYDTYSGEYIRANERWHTWFCIYRREALECDVSHAYHEEIIPGPVPRNTWDSAGYFQKALKEEFGYRLAVIDRSYQPYFIHYGAFAKNRHIDQRNIGIYRRIQIMRKRGVLGVNNRVTRRLAGTLDGMIFGRVDRGTYVEGWKPGK